LAASASVRLCCCCCPVLHLPPPSLHPGACVSSAHPAAAESSEAVTYVRVVVHRAQQSTRRASNDANLRPQRYLEISAFSCLKRYPICTTYRIIFLCRPALDIFTSSPPATAGFSKMQPRDVETSVRAMLLFAKVGLCLTGHALTGTLTPLQILMLIIACVFIEGVHRCRAKALLRHVCLM
jgi:hypothetical protein